jgi:glycosyltransferase involved in cell wall biosynthesis
MKILCLTSVYPADDIPQTFTPVVHYFTREWVRLGYEVLVIHNQTIYPRFYYALYRFLKRFIPIRLGFVIQASRNDEYREYRIDNVKVIRLSILKFIPFHRFSKKKIKKQTEKIIEVLIKNKLIPNVIIGHWFNPQLELINQLKNMYNDSKTCIVMHDGGAAIKKLYKNTYNELIASIDIWGYRSLQIKKDFESQYGEMKRNFICYSGVPEHFIAKENKKTFSAPLKKFLFVGLLIERKNPDALIKAISKIYGNKHDYSILYIGDGKEKDKLRLLAKEGHIEDKIYLMGRLEREEVSRNMIDSECFIMISRDETFGLVYIEAMGSGCITLASKGEGMDGVIVNGVNGFLCTAGNYHELAKIIIHINNLSPTERMAISNNAISTALSMTDKQVAKKYIESIVCEK